MTGVVIVGTDTNAGKTWFSAQWLAAFPGKYAYWKPVETGESDTETIRGLVPAATIFPPLARFIEPVAPALAAAREGRRMPGVDDILAAIPASPLPLLIETFGGPVSPLTDDVLQVELLVALKLPIILVTTSSVGAIGRTLQSVAALREHGLAPTATVLIGPTDDYAVRQIERHTQRPVFSLLTSPIWTRELVAELAMENESALIRIAELCRSERAGQALRGIASGLASGFTRGACAPRSEENAEHRDILKRDRAAVWHPYTPINSQFDPLCIVGASDEFLNLADGRHIIDGISSWWTILHGHQYLPLMQALRDASDTWDHVIFAGATHPPGVALAELLLSTMPWDGGRVFYSDNGSTAVEVALKMAYQWWCHRGEAGRTHFIGFEDAYHGDTFGAMSAGRDPLFAGRFGPLLFPSLRIPLAADALDAALTENRGRVAAVIIEPLVQGAGGMKMHTPRELRDISEVARRHDILLILDEVMTGGGRTGTLWAHEQAGIIPDLVCISKTLAGGIMPLAATLASPRVVAEFDTADRTHTFFHGHSFTGHPLACAVAVANMRELKTGAWKADVNRIEAVWNERLLPLGEYPGVSGVRIRGSIAAIEIDADGGYLAEVGPRFHKRCLVQGVFLRPLGNVLYALPPYRTSDDSLHRIADAMNACVKEIRGGS